MLKGEDHLSGRQFVHATTTTTITVTFTITTILTITSILFTHKTKSIKMEISRSI